ncbi:SWR1 complex subunit 2, partial [Durusdinium trenchii]
GRGSKSKKRKKPPKKKPSKKKPLKKQKKTNDNKDDDDVVKPQNRPKAPSRGSADVGPSAPVSHGDRAAESALPDQTAEPSSRSVNKSNGGKTSTGPSKRTPPRTKSRTRCLSEILLDDNARKLNAARSLADLEAPDYLNARARPSQRPPLKLCVVTNLPAWYRDPVSRLPFATPAALEQLREQPPPWVKASANAPFHEAIRIMQDERRRAVQEASLRHCLSSAQGCADVVVHELPVVLALTFAVPVVPTQAHLEVVVPALSSASEYLRYNGVSLVALDALRERSDEQVWQHKAQQSLRFAGNTTTTTPGNATQHSTWQRFAFSGPLEPRSGQWPEAKAEWFLAIGPADMVSPFGGTRKSVVVIPFRVLQVGFEQASVAPPSAERTIPPPDQDSDDDRAHIEMRPVPTSDHDDDDQQQGQAREVHVEDDSFVSGGRVEDLVESAAAALPDRDTLIQWSQATYVGKASIDPAAFERRWAAEDEVEVWGVDMDLPDLEAFRKRFEVAHIYCLASGEVGDIAKFYFFALPRDAEAESAMVEASLSKRTGRLTCVFKLGRQQTSNPTEQQPFVAAFKRLATG